MPGGMTFRSIWQVAVTWAWASAMLAPGRKKMRMIPTPLSAWLSMCSMPLTEAVRMRSLTNTMRVSTSSAGMPKYDQTTLTTGTSMFGKMSVDMRVMLTAPSTTISKAATTNVYVRRRASLTIHMNATSDSG